MTELELMANEEARHGNREALERLEAELREARMTELSALGQAQEAYEAQQRLEAENKLLNEQMAVIEEMGTESLNALPDCLMRLAPALVENDELKAKLAKAVEALGILADDTNWFDAVEEDGTVSAAWRATGSPEEIARTTLAELTGGDDE